MIGRESSLTFLPFLALPAFPALYCTYFPIMGASSCFTLSGT